MSLRGDKNGYNRKFKQGSDVGVSEARRSVGSAQVHRHLATALIWLAGPTLYKARSAPPIQDARTDLDLSLASACRGCSVDVEILRQPRGGVSSGSGN